MGRNNERNIKKHNDKLHKAQDKVKQSEVLRKEKLMEKTAKLTTHFQSKLTTCFGSN